MPCAPVAPPQNSRRCRPSSSGFSALHLEVHVFPRFRAPFLSYRDVSPWRLSIQTFQSVSHPLKSPPELRPRPTLQRARGRENAGGGHKSQGSDLSTPPLHRAQARAQRGGGRRVSPMAGRVPSPGPSAALAPRPPVGASAPGGKETAKAASTAPRRARVQGAACCLGDRVPFEEGRGFLPSLPGRASPQASASRAINKNVDSTFWPCGVGRAGPGAGCQQNKGPRVAGGSTKPRARPRPLAPEP